MLKRANTDVLAGLSGLLIFAIFWLAREEGWRTSTAVWPESILYAILVFSGILIAKGLIQRQVFEIFGEGSKLRMLIAAVGLIAWGVGVHYLGFVFASLVMFLLLSWYVTRAEQFTSPDVAVRMTPMKAGIWLVVILVEIGLLYYVFSKLLLVPLPRGIAF